MANVNITYRVTGRYMNGSSVEAYHLVGEDGSQMVANKERIIFLIGRGQIENMRLQSNGNELIIRGKGVNLNALPIFDTSKGNFRGNAASQAAIASSNVTPKKNSGINVMGQLRLVKRIMYKTNCLGYIVADVNGVEKKLNRKKVLELAMQKLISNAVVQRWIPKGETQSQLILRGVGCDINSLPVVTVDQNGNMIDPNEIAKQEYVYMRAVRMKRGGIIHDNKKNKNMSFESGDYILCGINGTLKPIKSALAKDVFTIDGEGTSAICDEFLNNLSYYPVELFGGTAQSLSEAQVKRWPIVKVKRTQTIKA